MCHVSYSKETEYSSKKKLEDFNGLPIWATIEITAKCSHKCKWCYGGFDGNIDKQLSVSDYKKILSKLKELNIIQITLTGGEPTEHPDFDEIVKLSKGFILNLATHGEWEDSKLPQKLKDAEINQIQFNYQGLKHHDSIHGVKGSYAKQVASIKRCKKLGINIVTSLTVGKYNIKDVPVVFKEMEKLGSNRLRVWETTGFGNKFKKDLEVVDIFDEVTKKAQELNYTYIQSYEPLVKGNVGVSCIALSGLFLFINYKGEHIFCGAVPSQLNKPLSNILTDSAKTILKNFVLFNNANRRDKPYCMARD